MWEETVITHYFMFILDLSVSSSEQKKLQKDLESTSDTTEEDIVSNIKQIDDVNEMVMVVIEAHKTSSDSEIEDDNETTNVTLEESTETTTKELEVFEAANGDEIRANETLIETTLNINSVESIEEQVEELPIKTASNSIRLDPYAGYTASKPKKRAKKKRKIMSEYKPPHVEYKGVTVSYNKETMPADMKK